MQLNDITWNKAKVKTFSFDRFKEVVNGYKLDNKPKEKEIESLYAKLTGNKIDKPKKIKDNGDM